MAAINWQVTGEGLALETAKEVAKEHNVPVDVVLKGSFVDAVDGPNGFSDFHGAEDHVIVRSEAAAKDFIKFANFQRFRDVCSLGQAQRQGGTLVVVVMPYADLNSCNKLQELDMTVPHHGYAKIEVANCDMLLWKNRGSSALKDEVAKCRRLSTRLEMTVRAEFPPDKYRKLALPLGEDRRIAKERLMKAHLDAKQYGDAHALLLLLDKRKHDTIFRSPGCYDPCSNPTTDQTQQRQQTATFLEAYKAELDNKLGKSELHVYPERSDVLSLEAQYKYRRDLADARRQIQDIVDTAKEEIDRISELLTAMGDEPTLLGCGI